LSGLNFIHFSQSEHAGKLPVAMKGLIMKKYLVLIALTISEWLTVLVNTAPV
jgi:hypothetical protein